MYLLHSMKIVTISIGTVELVDKITWGMQEEIRSAMLGGFSLSGITDKEKQDIKMDASVIAKAKYKALELCIKKITLTDGTEITYSKEWMDNLSIEDGDLLAEAVDEATSPKKK